MMTEMTMISWQWQISAAEDDAGLWQCMYNVRARPCDAADSPMKRENLGRSSPSRHLQLHARLVPIRINFIISHIKSHYWWGFQVSVFNHLLIWFDFSEYIVYWLKGPVEPLSSSIDDFWSDEGHTYWLASPKLDLVRPLILSKNQSVPVSSTKDLSGAQLKDSYSILLRAADASLTDFSLFVSILTNDQFVPGWVFPSLPTLS